MPPDPQLDERIADDLISSRLKKSDSDISGLGKMTYGEIKQLASSTAPDPKALEMKNKARKRKKLIEENPRPHGKARRSRR
jgi:hypothetical protein